MANSGPTGQLFALLFILGIVALIDRLTQLVTTIRRNRRARTSADETPDPIDSLAEAISNSAAATLEFTRTIAPLLKSIQDTALSAEAGVAGVAASLAKRQPVDTAIMESQDVMAQTLDRLQKSIANIRTKEDAALQNTELRDGVKTDTLLAVAPVLNQVAENGKSLGAVQTKADDLLKKVDQLPPHLDALIVKLMADMPPLVRQEYAALLSENKALAEQKVQAEAARDTWQAAATAKDAQLATLRADLQQAHATIEATVPSEGWAGSAQGQPGESAMTPSGALGKPPAVIDASVAPSGEVAT